jgi:molybdate transport system regulatory protein
MDEGLTMKLRFKVWSEVDGKPLFGPGRYRLLSALRRSGSINAAATEAGISYRRAWGQIREMERLLGAPLIVSNRGGAKGGGTLLTRKALNLMRRYERACERAAQVLDEKGTDIER